MSTSIFILGQSGTGKSTSLRNLDPRRVLLIQSIRKPLPFRSANWKYITADEPNGSILVSDNPQEIIHHIRMTRRPIIVIDDFQYVMANEFMRRAKEKGFEKFTEIGLNFWNLIREAGNLPDDKTVYLLHHSETDVDGNVKEKTIGKLLDEKICIAGMFS